MEDSDRRLPAVVIAFAAVLIAGAGVTGVLTSSGGDADPPASRAAPSVAPDATAPPRTNASGGPAVDVAITSCHDAAAQFLLLCEVYRHLTESYVDALDDTELAEAAAHGIETAEVGATPAPAPTDAAAACAAPAPSFGEMCRAYGDALGRGVSEDALVEAAVTGMVSAVDDPHTAYVPPRENEIVEENLEGRVEGIGAIIEIRPERREGLDCRVISEECPLVVVAPVPGGPSDEAGIRAADEIVAFDGDAVAGMTIGEAAATGRGPAGTDVVVTIERNGSRLDKQITRREFEVPHTETDVLPGGVGYLKLYSFAANSPEQFHTALENLLDEGARHVVVDLRDNPGGYLSATTDIAGEFITGDVVFVEESSGGDTDSYRADGRGLATGESIRVAVLVNGGSASASEVFAAALRDAGRAVLVGQQTFGKGSVQTVWDLSNGGSLRVTVARWLTPDGEYLDGVGLEPDIPVQDSDPDDAEDLVLERAAERLRAGG